jgi:MMPL family
MPTDYEVFVLSRMREEHDESHSTEQAVVNALARTGRLVMSAAPIPLHFVRIDRPDPFLMCPSCVRVLLTRPTTAAQSPREATL